MAAINALLQYREAAGISKANKYVFASIQEREYPYFKAKFPKFKKRIRISRQPSLRNSRST